MSLPTRQERLLNQIEHSLHSSEPRLRSMFAIFTKLTWDEEMPRLEELQSRAGGRSSLLRRRRKRLARPGRERQMTSGIRAAGTRLRVITLATIMVLTLTPAAILGIVTRHGPLRPGDLRCTAPALSQVKCLPVPQGWSSHNDREDDSMAEAGAKPACASLCSLRERESSCGGADIAMARLPQPWVAERCTGTTSPIPVRPEIPRLEAGCQFGPHGIAGGVGAGSPTA